MTAVLAFASACLLVAAVLVTWRLTRTLPTRLGVAAQLRAGRARLSAAIARLAADVSTVDAGVDAVARRHLADAAERLATACDLYEHADTPEEVLTVALTLVEGTRSANRARGRLGLPRRKLPAIRGHRRLVRRTRGKVQRAEWRMHRRQRWTGWVAAGIAGLPAGFFWYIALIAEAARPISFTRWFFALLPLAVMAVLFVWAVLTAVHKSELAFDEYAQRHAEAEALLARIARRLADPAAAGTPHLEEYTEALDRLAAARTVDEVEAAISAARAAERTG